MISSSAHFNYSNNYQTNSCRAAGSSVSPHLRSSKGPVTGLNWSVTAPAAWCRADYEAVAHAVHSGGRAPGAVSTGARDGWCAAHMGANYSKRAPTLN